MRIIIATDIFGQGEYIDELSNLLETSYSSVVIVSPYSNQQVMHTDENKAYQRFLLECGHDKYSRFVTEEISNSKETTFLIGFSAGASAIWHSIGSNAFTNLTRFVGFYPSQIRNHKNLSPPCPTTIIFPCREESFDIIEVTKTLRRNPSVECQLTHLHHGFMNPKSCNYSSIEASAFYTRLQSDILSARSSLQKYSFTPR